MPSRARAPSWRRCSTWPPPQPRWLWLAFGLLPLAFILDALDGRIARWRFQSSPLGADLDSLSDVISFGMAPAALAFAMGLRGALDVVVLLYFVGCGISRLARFNVTAATLSDGSGKVKYFEGTPIPTSLALVMVLAFFFWQGPTGDALPFGVWDVGPFQFHPHRADLLRQRQRDDQQDAAHPQVLRRRSVLVGLGHLTEALEDGLHGVHQGHARHLPDGLLLGGHGGRARVLVGAGGRLLTGGGDRLGDDVPAGDERGRWPDGWPRHR